MSSNSTSTNLRPFTNNDPTNDAVYKHGLPRPLKWNYRLGKINTVSIDDTHPDTYQITNNARYVRSSKSAPLIGLLMDRPGHSIMTGVASSSVLGTCITPDSSVFMTDCCKAKHALDLVRGPSTVIKPNPNTGKDYYPTQQQYLRSRGKTLKQNSFHYANGAGCDPANINAPMISTPIFAPNNEQFSQQGGVSSSSRTTRLTLNTIKTAVNASIAQPVHKNFDTCRTALPASMRASQRCR
jgi:hypothetical protein